MKLNDVVKELKYWEDIPLYKGGPMGTDTLFYLHTLKNVEGALAIGGGLYLNGNFDEIKRYILQGNQVEGNIRFFLGYSGWQDGQLNHEIAANTWMIGKGEASSLMIDEIKYMMQKNLSCRNLKEAQKNMYCYGFSFIPVNFLFLCLGILLLVLAQKMNLTLPALSDDILPMASSHSFLLVSKFFNAFAGLVEGITRYSIPGNCP